MYAVVMPLAELLYSAHEWNEIALMPEYEA